jgi:hypothetical protein
MPRTRITTKQSLEPVELRFGVKLLMHRAAPGFNKKDSTSKFGLFVGILTGHLDVFARGRYCVRTKRV